MFVECVNSNLDLFEPKKLQTKVLGTTQLTFYPIQAITDQSETIEFSIMNYGEKFLDLTSAYLFLEVQLNKDAAGTAHAAKAKVACVNNLLDSLFSSCKVLINNKEISSTDTSYHYKAYIQDLINHSTGSANNHLSTSLYHLDEKPFELVAGKDANPSWTKRQEALDSSKVVQLAGKIHHDLFSCGKALLPGFDIRIIFTRSPPTFYINTLEKDDTSIIKINQAKLYINAFTVAPELMLDIQKKLQTQNAVYPIKKTELRQISIPNSAGSTYAIDNLFLGRTMSLLAFALVGNKANSDRTLNPYYFQHFKLKKINLLVNNAPVINEALRCDFTAKNLPQTARAYSEIWKNLNAHESDDSQLTLERFNDGYTIFFFDLTVDKSANTECQNIPTNSTIRIELEFDGAITNPMTALVYAEYDSEIQLTSTFEVIPEMY